MQDRLANLFGAAALAASDRVAAKGANPAVLVHLLARPGDSVEAVGRVVRISQPGAVRAVNRLEAQGLLERRPGPDGRTLALHLTVRGRRAARGVLAQRERGVRELLDLLDPDEQERLLPLLEKLVAGLAVDRPGALSVCRLCDRDACCGEAPCPLQHTVPAAA
jgi:DNA-binding MarR family transcriptional regulator